MTAGSYFNERYKNVCSSIVVHENENLTLDGIISNSLSHVTYKIMSTNTVLIVL